LLKFYKTTENRGQLELWSRR